MRLILLSVTSSVIFEEDQATNTEAKEPCGKEAQDCLTEKDQEADDIEYDQQEGGLLLLKHLCGRKVIV